jgi:hypothetical protein
MTIYLNGRTISEDRRRDDGACTNRIKWILEKHQRVGKLTEGELAALQAAEPYLPAGYLGELAKYPPQPPRSPAINVDAPYVPRKLSARELSKRKSSYYY